MSSDLSRQRLWWVLLLLGSAALAFWQLGYLPLLDVDEPVYGEIGREMARGGWATWLTPHYHGQPWFDKPPLFYWLTAISMRLFGVSEFSARLPSALLGVTVVALTYALAQRAYPQVRNVGLWSGFALATCVQHLVLARAAVTDMTLACTLTGALLALYAWVTTRHPGWALLAGALAGLAALAKSPAYILLIGAQMILYLCLTRQARRLLSPVLWAGFVVSLLVAAPWYLAMLHLHGQQFIRQYLEANNVTRYLAAEHKTTQAWWYFAPIFLGLFFPWTLLLPQTAVRAWRAAREERQSGEPGAPALYLALWCLLIFFFFSASQSKLWTYIAPLYPAAAILVGLWVAERSEARRRDKSLLVYGVVFAALGIAFWSVGRRYGVAPVTLAIWAATLAGAAVLSFTMTRQAGRWLIPGIATGIVVLAAFCSPTWKTRETEVSERIASRAASGLTPPGQTIHVLGLEHPSFLYYATRPVVYEEDRTAATRYLNTHPGAIYAMRPVTLDELRVKHGYRNYRILRNSSHTLIIEATAPQARSRK